MTTTSIIEISLNVGDTIGIGEECVGIIDSERDDDCVHITSETFCGWASRAELRDGIVAELESDGPCSE